jgi:hypothetical protein
MPISVFAASVISRAASHGRAFDEMLFHMPARYARLAEAGLIADAEAQNVYPDQELLSTCRTLFLDLPSMGRTILGLGLPTELLCALQTDGLAALPALDRACWEAFLAAEPRVARAASR